jgi:hypothetical protein
MTQIQQVWPSSITVFYDPTIMTPITYDMPWPPVDSQEVEFVNVSESPIEITVHATGHFILDPLSHQKADNCEISQANAATRFKFRAEDRTWYPLNLENEYSSVAINTYDLVALPSGTLTLSKGNRTVEVISPGLVKVGPPSERLRQRITVKNSCPESDDVVLVQTTSDVFRMDSGKTVTALGLLRGDSVVIQAFATYWLVISYTPAIIRNHQVQTPYELKLSERFLEITGGTTPYLGLPNPGGIPQFAGTELDRVYTIRNSTAVDLNIISHHDPAGYTISMVDLGGGLFGVTSTQGTSDSFVFFNQTWTSMHCDSANDTFHFLMPAQPQSPTGPPGQAEIPYIKVFISGLDGVRNSLIFPWNVGTSRYTGSWPGLHAALTASAWPNAVTIWPIGETGDNNTIKLTEGVLTNEIILGSGLTRRLLLDAEHDLWVPL